MRASVFTSLTNIVIYSDIDWPVWALVLRDLFESLPLVNVTLCVSSFRWRNAFGLNRIRNVTWLLAKDDIMHKLSAQISAASTLFLSSGTLSGFASLLTWFPPSSYHRHVTLLDTKHRLDVLSKFDVMIWKRVKHHYVGGVSCSQWWLGDSSPVDISATPHPVYCPLALFDLLEYAPAGVHVTSCDRPPDGSTILHAPQDSSHLAASSAFDSRCSSPIFVGPDSLSAFGLLPHLPRRSSSVGLPSVVCGTPFTQSKWGLREFTVAEWARFYDLPVSCEKWFKSVNLQAHQVPFFGSPPLKVCVHALWLCGLFHVSNTSRQGGTSISSFDEIEIDNQFTKNKVMIDQEDFSKHDHRPIDTKAVKEDDASVPVDLWNQQILNRFPWLHRSNSNIIAALDTMRGFLLRVWWRRLLKSFLRYLSIEWPDWSQSITNGTSRDTLPSNLQKDLSAACDCLNYATKSNWWEWKGGSRLFFWRWTPEFRTFARDGIPICWLPGKRPKNRKPQPPVKDTVVLEAMKAKVNKVKRRGYVKPGYVHSLIRYFAVPKGLSDIRMVYDGTASGFNDSVWIENFGLPTIETLIRGTSPDTWMVDLDIGDMFLNFMLHEEAQQYVGIDVTLLFPEEMTSEQKTLWLVWVRCAMGLKVSPNQAIRAILFAEEFFKGIPSESINPFQIGRVRLNLPGSTDYTPSLPWISLLDLAEQLATLLAIYVDDERIHANSEKAALQAAHQVASRESYLGIQDAARKRRPPSQNAGAWAGSILRTNGAEVGKLVSDERWTKARNIIRKWHDRLSKSPQGPLDLKELLSDRGFLIYIVRTYDCMNTYLKGFHLTIDSWRDNRDDDGWKLSTSHIMNKINPELESEATPPAAPSSVKAVPRFKDDLKALTFLTSSEIPPVVKVQTKSIYIVKYKFGDASGGGFGVSTLTANNGEFHIKAGTWTEKGSANSSNFREFGNFVLDLEEESKLGNLEGAEIFTFTDNSTTESAFYNGTTSSKRLFDLVLRVKKLELNHSVKIHFIHVSGKRMIAQGTDGISRGNLLEGVMAGKQMIEFVPLNLTALERSPMLIEWISSWTLEFRLSFLNTEDWFWKGQGLSDTFYVNCDGMKFPQKSDYNAYVWCPPPCIADVCLEELRKSKHKRPDLTHIFVCPKLMTPRWRKHLLKSCTFSFYLDPGTAKEWSEDMFESLLVAIFLPSLHCFPWTLKSSNSVLEVERQLRKMQPSTTRSKAIILRQFLSFQRNLSTLSESMVRNMLQQGRIR